MDIYFLWGLKTFLLPMLIVYYSQCTKWGVQVGKLETTQGANPLNKFNFDDQRIYSILKLALKSLFMPIENFNKFVTTLVKEQITQIVRTYKSVNHQITNTKTSLKVIPQNKQISHSVTNVMICFLFPEISMWIIEDESFVRDVIERILPCSKKLDCFKVPFNLHILIFRIRAFQMQQI